jgi:non-ribosomal peptide synthetase component E (peptide arylation enzyme)
MPISSPPQDYKLSPTGTSGTPVGPDILIVDDDLKKLPPGGKGNILVKGLPCFGSFLSSIAGLFASRSLPLML